MTTIRLTVLATLTASTMTLLGGNALAQSAPGAGQGAGAAAAASAPGMGMGPGMRSGRGMSAQWGSNYTPGWSLMTLAERNAHRDQMRSMKTYEECKTYKDQTHEQMAARAKEKGKTLSPPRRDACAALKP
jgi:hypothetical protein